MQRKRQLNDLRRCGFAGLDQRQPFLLRPAGDEHFRQLLRNPAGLVSRQGRTQCGNGILPPALALLKAREFDQDFRVIRLEPQRFTERLAPLRVVVRHAVEFRQGHERGGAGAVFAAALIELRDQFIKLPLEVIYVRIVLYGYSISHLCFV